MTTTEDFFETAEEDMEKQAEADELANSAENWDPKPGDLLRGVFLKASPVTTKYGPSIVAIIKDLESGEAVKVWCSRTVLKNEMIEAAPKAGTLIAIKYVGEQESKDGSFTYHLYQVRAQEQDIPYWTQVANPVVTNEGVEKPETPFVPPDEAPF